MIRYWIVLVLLVASGCSTVERAEFSSATASLVRAQDTLKYRGFTGEKREALPKAFTHSGVQLRNEPEYEAIVGDPGAIAAPDLSCERYVIALRTLLDQMEASKSFSDANGERALDILKARVDVLERALAPYKERSLAEASERMSVPLEGWEKTQVGDVPERSGRKGVVHGFFLAASGSSLPLYVAYEDERGVEDPTYFAFLTDEQAWSVAAFCDLASYLKAQVVPIGPLVAKMDAGDLAWENYLQRGYPQYPWENLLNDKLVSSAWNRPPTHQFVFLHAAPGVLFLLDDAKSSTFEAALLVQALGYIRYFDEDRGWYLGGSLTAAFPADDDVGLGYGVTVHLASTTGTLALPPLDLGVLWHEGQDSDGVMISVGVDVLKLLGQGSSKKP